MNKKEKELNLITKILDKLEQRIAKLEKVLASHAKCIGAIRKICDEWFKILPRYSMSYAYDKG